MKLKYSNHNNNRRGGNKLLLLGTCTLLVLLLVRFDYFITGFSNFISPLKQKVYLTSLSVKIHYNAMIHDQKLAEENLELKARLEKDTLLEKSNEELLEENNKLRSALNLKKKSRFEIIAAQVSYIDSKMPFNNISVNKGIVDGVQKGMIVSSSKGLVGQVTEVKKESSTVKLLTSSSSFVSAISNNKHNLGILQGNENEILSLEYIIKEKDVQVGDRVYTSGISKIFPRGLFIGFISKIDNSSPMFKEIQVKLPYNVFNLDVVFIHKNTGGQR